MNFSDLLLYLFLFAVGAVFAFLAATIVGVFNLFLINRFLSESVLRNSISLLLILVFSFISSMIGFLGVVGIAGDENGGEIVPYYLGISALVAIIATFGYYYFRIRS